MYTYTFSFIFITRETKSFAKKIPTGEDMEKDEPMGTLKGDNTKG